ncbi:unnamed protein product [Amoebophrya sp. A120]|nr:unnamed protein product [Amoebophrya sp. A120]|eukprot:GSA120T00017733001.1
MQQQSVDPKAFSWKVHGMVCLVILDCIANSFTEHLWGDDNVGIVVALFAVVVLSHCLLLLLYFTLLWHTFLLRFGLLGEAFQIFRSIYLLGFVRLVLMLASRIPRLMAAVGGWKIAEYWDESLYIVLYCLHTLVSVVYYTVYLRATNSLGKSRFYSAELWHQSLKRL